MHFRVPNLEFLLESELIMLIEERFWLIYYCYLSTGTYSCCYATMDKETRPAYGASIGHELELNLKC